MHIIAGLYKNREIRTPKGDKTRPTSSKLRKSVFDILQNQIEGAKFLDLFAGSGSMGLEAISRGATATFVERDRMAASCIRANLESFQIDANVIQLDVNSAIKQIVKKGERFDIIYIDPPYTLDIQVLLEELPEVMNPEGMVILEQRKNTPIQSSVLKKTDERKFGDTVLYFFIT